MIKKNIGRTDRLIRLFIAIALLGFSYSYESWFLLIAGLFVLFEATFSWCIFNQLMGKSSCKIKN